MAATRADGEDAAACRLLYVSTMPRLMGEEREVEIRRKLVVAIAGTKARLRALPQADKVRFAAEIAAYNHAADRWLAGDLSATYPDRPGFLNLGIARTRARAKRD